MKIEEWRHRERKKRYRSCAPYAGIHNTERSPQDEETVKENEEVEEMEKSINKTNLDEQEKNWSRDRVRTCLPLTRTRSFRIDARNKKIWRCMTIRKFQKLTQ